MGPPGKGMKKGMKNSSVGYLPARPSPVARSILGEPLYASRVRLTDIICLFDIESMIAKRLPHRA